MKISGRRNEEASSAVDVVVLVGISCFVLFFVGGRIGDRDAFLGFDIPSMKSEVIQDAVSLLHS